MAMGSQLQSSAKLTVACGLGAAAIGLFYILLYVASVPGPADHSEPAWLGFVFGLAFLLGGIAVIIQTALTKGNPSTGDFPATAPLWLTSIHRMMVLGIISSLGIIFSWVAIGPGQRHFTGSGVIFGETVGRAFFGIGAALIWIIFVAVLITSARRFLAQKWSRGRDLNSTG
jgi:hypothetical protein